MLAPLNGNRALLAYENWVSDEIEYQVLNSSGSQYLGPASLNHDGSAWYDYYPDAARLSSGKVLAAWYGGGYIRYQLVDGNNYAPIDSPVTLRRMSETADHLVSVTSDTLGNGIISWGENDMYNRRSIYYAVVSEDGSLKSPPAVLMTANSTLDLQLGQSSTSYTTLPSTLGVDLYASGKQTYLASPELPAVIEVDLGNLGQSWASGVTLTASGLSGLVVMGSDPAADCSGDACWWDIPDLQNQSMGKVKLFVSVPDGELGASYPITFTIQSNEQDGIPGNNSLAVTVIHATPSFLPYIRR